MNRKSSKQNNYKPVEREGEEFEAKWLEAKRLEDMYIMKRMRILSWWLLAIFLANVFPIDGVSVEVKYIISFVLGAIAFKMYQLISEL